MDGRFFMRANSYLYEFKSFEAMPAHLQQKVYLLLAALQHPEGRPRAAEIAFIPKIGRAKRSDGRLQVHLTTSDYVPAESKWVLD